MPKWTAMVLVALSAIGWRPAIAQAFVVPPDASVGGRSQAEWSVAWWQWAHSFEDDESPVVDRTGSRCTRRQGSLVWFLAGTFGARRTQRSCTVPRDTYLFFPLINYVSAPRSGALADCSTMIAAAAEWTDHPSALVLEVDGTRVTDLDGHRQATTECFDTYALRRGAPSFYPSAANGYYVMLRPLEPGRHEISFGGALRDFAQALTYVILVE